MITFRVSRRRREMYRGHARLCVCLHVCLSDCLRMHTLGLLHGPECNLKRVLEDAPSCALLGGFAIGARGLHCHGNITRTLVTSANAKCQRVLCTRSTPSSQRFSLTRARRSSSTSRASTLSISESSLRCRRTCPRSRSPTDDRLDSATSWSAAGDVSNKARSSASSTAERTSIVTAADSCGGDAAWKQCYFT